MGAAETTAALETLRELFAHQAWADAVHWHVLAKHGEALEDPRVRERLYHVHVVQAAFLELCQGRRPAPRELESYPGMEELRQDARRTHEELRAFVAGLSEADLERVVEVPWFEGRSFRVREALLQVVTHSQYHRGQNATRLRELGGKPPTTDLIVWYWKERPEPRWD